NIESEFGEKLFDHILQKVNDEIYERILVNIRRILDDPSPANGPSESLRMDSNKWAYQKMMRTKRGERAQNSIKQKQDEQRAEKEKQIAELKTGLSRIQKGEKDTFRDEQVMRSLPATIIQMYAKGNETAAKVIIDRLGAGLIDEELSIRSNVSEVLLSIFEKLSPPKSLEIIRRISSGLIDWVKLENASNPCYKKICHCLVDLAHDYIQNKEFFEYQSILETFKFIQSSEGQKEKDTQLVASVTLTSITTGDNVNMLVEELQNSDKKSRDDAIYSLVQLGGVSATRLLDLLKETHDLSIRARIVQVLSDIGFDAVPALIKRIHADEPWYYLRNLVLILGKIGNEDNLNILQPLLTHDEYRVQRESLNSIYAIGGEKRAKTLLSLLSVVGDRLKIDIVGMLGTLKCDQAEPALLKMLDPKTSVISRERNDLMEKVCNVLGSIGTEEAVSTLKSIVEQKRSLIGKRIYNEKIQIAADNALTLIQNKIMQVEDR
ncbi:HEAT repeat domain-containing protein, partial [Thermodesulfobacteriota bacterium]